MKTMKVICVGDPTQEYQEWIYRITGLEISRIPLKIGMEYECIGKEIEGKCWGCSQSYYFISGLGEVGKIPTKYFKQVNEIREDRLDDLLDSGDDNQ